MVSYKDKFTSPSVTMRDKQIRTWGRTNGSFLRDRVDFPRIRDAYKVTSLRSRLTTPM